MAKRTARVILAGSGRGLLKDAELIQQVLLSAGWEAVLVVVPRPSEGYFRMRSWFDRFKARLPLSLRKRVIRLQLFSYRLWALPLNKVLLTIHLENIYARYIPAGSRHWLIPNPERIRPGALQYLQQMNHIVCKSRDAQKRFSALHNVVGYSGFSGEVAAHLPPRTALDYRRFLHVAGNSQQKGTAAVTRLWSYHPEWPVLDLVIDDRHRLAVMPDNVRVHECIDHQSLNNLRAACGIVLAPSESEGFGHVLLEGMAFGGVVVTVDAPPMNELVNNQHGYLVPCAQGGKCRLGEVFLVAETSLEQTINAILAEEPAVLCRLSQHARNWVVENHTHFIRRFNRYLQHESGQL